MATFQDSTKPTAFPQYTEMIMEAIEALDEKEGSNKSAIWSQIVATYPDLPPSHSALLSHYLDKMKESGELVLVKNNYMKRDPNAPPKRGRGRPPKPKDPAAVAASAATPVVSPPRPRGRPPKPRDPFAPASPASQKSTAGSGKPRGRPPKMAKTEAGPVPTAAPTVEAPPAAAVEAPPAAAETNGVKRGRGRPTKVKPAVAPVAG